MPKHFSCQRNNLLEKKIGVDFESGLADNECMATTTTLLVVLAVLMLIQAREPKVNRKARPAFCVDSLLRISVCVGGAVGVLAVIQGFVLEIF